MDPLSKIQKTAHQAISKKLFGKKGGQTYTLFGAEIEFFLQNAEEITHTNHPTIIYLYNAIKTQGEQHGVNVEQIDKEDGVNQFEIQTAPTNNVSALAGFIESLQEDAFQKKNGITLQAKPAQNQPSSGMHFHISLYDSNDINLFGPVHPNSPVYQANMHHAIGGLLNQMPQSMHIFAPTENCYKRYAVPPKGSTFKHNPTNYSWGINNRTCAIRIPRSITVLPSNTRIEHRVCSPMANPTIAIGEIIRSITKGIMEESKPPAAIFGDAFEPTYFPTASRFPTSLQEAMQSQKAPKSIHEILEQTIGLTKNA